jgi:hypothetical protein
MRFVSDCAPACSSEEGCSLFNRLPTALRTWANENAGPGGGWFDVALTSARLLMAIESMVCGTTSSTE